MRKLLSIGKASGKQLEKIVGHATFIGLGRREALSIFGETYTFVQRHYHYSKRLWGSVRRELQIFCGIAPLIWRDLSLPWCQQVTAIDASTWGMGATVAEFPLKEVVELGRFSERWRFESEALSKLRSTAFGADVAVGSEEADANLWAATTTSQACSGIKPIQVVDQKNEDDVFKQLPFSTVDRAWKVVGRSKWRRIEAIPVLEARASLYAVKHALRSQGAFGKRHLVLSDSISAICALDRGCGKAFRMRRVSQQVCALTLATNTAFCYRWLPSEWNPADGPSRGSYFPSRGVQFPARERYPSGHDSSAPEFEPWSQAKTPKSELVKQAKSETSQRCSQGGASSEEKTAGRTTGGSGVTETGFGGKQLPCSISGMLGTVDSPLRSEVELQNSSWNSGSEVSGFLDHMFANGEDLSQGQYMVAATRFMLPHLRSPKYTLMPLTKQSLQGWRKLDPPKSRLPMPWEVTCFMAQEAIAMGKLQEALMMLFCFALYLRPGEVSKLRIMDLVPPVPRANQSSCHWSVVLHPMEVGVPSKTAEFDETVSFDLPDLDFIPRETSRLMKVRFRDRAEPLFSATGSQLRSVMEAIASKHGLQQRGPPHPYRLRHGGASHDFARQRRSLVEIQRRGRWKSFSSVRRYEKGGRIDQMLNSLPKPLLDRILLAAKNIQRTVQSQR